MKRTIEWTCKECEHAFEVTVWPVIPAKTYGRPEDCYPEEGGEIEPGACERCGAEIDAGDAQDQAAEEARDAREAREVAMFEAYKEAGL